MATKKIKTVATVESIMARLRRMHPDRSADVRLYHQDQKDGRLYVSALAHLFQPDGIWVVDCAVHDAASATEGYTEALQGLLDKLERGDWNRPSTPEVPNAG